MLIPPDCMASLNGKAEGHASDAQHVQAIEAITVGTCV